MCHPRAGGIQSRCCLGSGNSEILDSRRGLLSTGVTFFRGNDGNRARFAVTCVTVIMNDSA